MCPLSRRRNFSCTTATHSTFAEAYAEYILLLKTVVIWELMKKVSRLLWE